MAGQIAYRQVRVSERAFLYREGDRLTVFTVMNMRVPTMTDFDQDPAEVIETDDYVRVDADRGIVEVFRKK